MGAHDAPAEEQHDDHDEDGEDHHTEAGGQELQAADVVGALIQKAEPPLAAPHEEEGADDGAGDGADAADDHNEEDLIGHGHGEALGLDAGHVHGHEAAAKAREEGTDDEGHHLMLRQVDAHGLRGDLIIPDGLEGPAVGGVYDQHDDGDAQPRHNDVGVEALEGGVLPQGVGAVGEGGEALILDEGADDLREAQGGDSQIVALQPQHGEADEPGQEGGDETGNDEGDEHSHNGAHRLPQKVAEGLRNGELDDAAVVVLVHPCPLGHGDGENGVGVGPHQHEPGMAQGE